MRRWRWLAVACALTGTPYLQAQVATSTPPEQAEADRAFEQKVRDIGSMLRCPVCLNLSIYDSPSEMARDMLAVVRDKVNAGETKEQIFAYYTERYGDWVLMAPPAHGVSLFVWLLPALVVVGGAAVILLAVQRWTKRTAPAGATAPAPSDEDIRRVRAEMAKERDDLD